MYVAKLECGWVVRDRLLTKWYNRDPILKWCVEQFGPQTYILNGDKDQRAWCHSYDQVSFTHSDDLTLFLLTWNDINADS